jgi:hypothetical protein
MRSRLGGRRVFVTGEMAAAPYSAGAEAVFATGATAIAGGGQTP